MHKYQIALDYFTVMTVNIPGNRYNTLPIYGGRCIHLLTHPYRAFTTAIAYLNSFEKPKRKHLTCREFLLNYYLIKYCLVYTPHGFYAMHAFWRTPYQLFRLTFIFFICLCWCMQIINWIFHMTTDNGLAFYILLFTKIV